MENALQSHICLSEPKVHVKLQQPSLQISVASSTGLISHSHCISSWVSWGLLLGTHADKRPPPGHCPLLCQTNSERVASGTQAVELLPRSEACHRCSQDIGLGSQVATPVLGQQEQFCRMLGMQGPELRVDRPTTRFSKFKGPEEKTCPWAAPTYVYTFNS